jgi:hypothetical protein
MNVKLFILTLKYYKVTEHLAVNESEIMLPVF